jgi:hypothetical protein
MSEQNEEILTGKDALEASHGYTAMPDPARIEEAQADQQRFDSAVERMNQPAEPGVDVNEPLPVHYHEPGNPNKTSDKRLTLEPDRAARDLAQWRQGQEDIQRALKDQELADEVERLRTESGQPQAQQQPQPQPEAPVQEPQPELPPVPPGLENDELVKAFQREPRILEAVNALSYQAEQKVAAAARQSLEYEQTLNRQYSQEVSSLATAAAASIYASFPEIAGLSLDQLPAALQVISKQSPERALQLKNHLTNVQALTAKAQQAQQQQHQMQQEQASAQFQAWSRMQDDAFEAATKSDPPQRQAAIRQEAHRMLREYGLSEQEIAHNWNTNPLLRSRAGQMVLRDAAAYRLQQRTAATVKPAPTPAPRMQVPGPTGQRATEEDADLRSLGQRLNQSHSAKDAAALLTARRARSR